MFRRALDNLVIKLRLDCQANRRGGTLERHTPTIEPKPIQVLTWFFAQRSSWIPKVASVNELTELHGKLQREQRRVLEAAALYPRELIFNVAIWQGQPPLASSFARQ